MPETLEELKQQRAEIDAEIEKLEAKDIGMRFARVYYAERHKTDATWIKFDKFAEDDKKQAAAAMAATLAEYDAEVERDALSEWQTVAACSSPAELLEKMRGLRGAADNLARERDDLYVERDAIQARIQRGGVEFDVTDSQLYDFVKTQGSGVRLEVLRAVMDYLAQHATVVQPEIADAETLEQLAELACEAWHLEDPPLLDGEDGNKAVNESWQHIVTAILRAAKPEIDATAKEIGRVIHHIELNEGVSGYYGDREIDARSGEAILAMLNSHIRYRVELPEAETPKPEVSRERWSTHNMPAEITCEGDVANTKARALICRAYNTVLDELERVEAERDELRKQLAAASPEIAIRLERCDAPTWRTDVANAPEDEWVYCIYEGDLIPYWAGCRSGDVWLDNEGYESNPPTAWMPIPKLPEDE